MQIDALNCIKKWYAIASVVSNCVLPIERRAHSIDNIVRGYKGFA